MEKYSYIVLCLALCLVSCSRPERTQQERQVLKVKTMVVAPQAHTSGTRYVGKIVPAHETPLSMQSSGRVVRLEAKNGQAVHAGQVILRIDSTQAVSALRGAEAAYHHAQDGYNRVHNVHQKGVVSDQKMVEIESQLGQAKAMYELALQRVRECVLTAPCEGVLNGLKVETGETVLPGVQLCSILDVSAFCVKFTVPEAEIGAIRKVQGEAECPAANRTFPIRVTENSLVANALTHTYEVTAVVDGGAEVLMPGMVAIVKVKGKPSVVSDQPSDIVIPAKCILMKPEGPTVWIKEKGTAVRRNIRIDGYVADGVRVTEGLQAGDSLIIEGYQKLYKGCKVMGNL